MPKLSPGQPFGPIPATVVLDGSGNGAVPFQATGSPVRVTNLFGKVSTTVNQAQVSVYIGTIADTNRVFNNNSGSTGFTAQGQIDIPDGTILYVVWTGGDAGATATATFSGRAIPFDQISGGFEMRADDPIAAGDGSLIFPAIKSVNYVPLTSGWALLRDGSAEFGNAVIRGTFSASNGEVIINGSGIILFQGLPNTVDIDFEGFHISYNQSLPGDYAETNLIIDPSTGVPELNMTPRHVDAIHSDMEKGVIQALLDYVNNGNWQPYLRLQSPTVSTGEVATIDLYGENFSTPGITKIAIDTTAIVNASGLEIIERKFLAPMIRTTNVVMGVGTEHVLFTTASTTWKANRAYRFKMNAQYQGASSGQQPVIMVRKGTGTGGTILINNGRIPYTAASANYIPWEGTFIVGSNDVTTTITITGGSVITTGTVTQNGSGTPPAMAETYDVGPASDYPGFGTLT